MSESAKVVVRDYLQSASYEDLKKLLASVDDRNNLLHLIQLLDKFV